jgi:HTH-type transcriptional regulator / antitoxin HipB
MQNLVTQQTLGMLLKDARNQRGLTQEEAGRRVGLKQPAISAIEAGKEDLRLNTLFKFLAALDYELLIQPKETGTKTNRGDEW